VTCIVYDLYFEVTFHFGLPFILELLASLKEEQAGLKEQAINVLCDDMSSNGIDMVQSLCNNYLFMMSLTLAMNLLTFTACSGFIQSLAP
jgi:hypothetical protein